MDVRLRLRSYAFKSSALSLRRVKNASNNEKVAVRDTQPLNVPHAAPSAATLWCRERQHRQMITSNDPVSADGCCRARHVMQLSAAEEIGSMENTKCVSR